MSLFTMLPVLSLISVFQGVSSRYISSPNRLSSLAIITNVVALALNGEDLNGSPQSSSASIFNLICTEDGPLVRCTTELRILEKLLGTGESPISEADFIHTLENLEKIKVVLLTVDQRLVRNYRSRVC